ncbi:MAG: family 1 glycosylhydrolase [Spirochaetales bacterium]|nr:family 1 glycosylhydrolase [Spirochaetales bacterium]
MSDSFNLANIYLLKTDNTYKWLHNAAKSLPLDDETAELFGDFRIEHQITDTRQILSISWAATQPTENSFSNDGINAMIREAQKMSDRSKLAVCLWDGILPEWVQDKGGMTWEQFSEAFVRYIEYVIRSIVGKFRCYIISNESNLRLYNDNITKANNITDKKSFETARTNLIVSHIKAYHKIREIHFTCGRESSVGVGLHFRMFDTSKLLTKMKENEQENLIQGEVFRALTTGEISGSSDKYPFGQQNFCDFIVLDTFSLSEAVTKVIGDKDFTSDEVWDKYKTTFCKMCMTYFSNDDIPKYVITK